MNDVPSISVVIPAYNRGYCIRGALLSVLEQDYPVLEIIVVDDGSDDDLGAALAPMKDRLRVVRHSTNIGAAAARNTGIQEAGGDYVAFLDSDDAWKPGKLARQIDFMQRRLLDFSCTGFETVWPGEERSAWTARRPYPSVMRLQDYVWGCYTSPGSTLVARRTLLEQCEGYDRGMARHEDWDLMLRLCRSSRNGIGFLNEPLSVVELGSKAGKDDVLASLASLDRLVERHHDVLRRESTVLARKLRSGVAFNRAAAHAADGNWVATARELVRSLLLVPMGNWPLQVILRERVRRTRARGSESNGFPPRHEGRGPTEC